MTSRILGVDPGLAETGWGVIEKKGSRCIYLAHGCIKTEAGEKNTLRLFKIYNELNAIIEEWRPRSGAIESLFFSRNTKTALPVAEARGVICLTMAKAGIEVFEYPPNIIKQAVTGTGAAEKNQIKDMVKLILGLEKVPRPDHAADALGAAICHAHYNAQAL